MFFSKIFIAAVVLLNCQHSIAQEKTSFTFIAHGLSVDRDYGDAELNMLADARYKCDAIGGPVQISATRFRENPKVIYATAQFECRYSALDRRKCNYFDDSNPECRKLDI